MLSSCAQMCFYWNIIITAICIIIYVCYNISLNGFIANENSLSGSTRNRRTSAYALSSHMVLALICKGNLWTGDGNSVSNGSFSSWPFFWDCKRRPVSESCSGICDACNGSKWDSLSMEHQLDGNDPWFLITWLPIGRLSYSSRSIMVSLALTHQCWHLQD